MIIECTSCHSKYQYNEDRFEGKASKKIKCAKCGTIFEIFNPTLTPGAPSAPSAPRVATPSVPPPRSSSATAVGDNTFHSSLKKKKEEPEPSPLDLAPPSTGKTPSGLQMPSGKRLSLAIIDGPDAGSVFRIEKPRVTIGRSGNDLNLNDTEASRQHAAVEVRDTLYTVNDLGSTNGTLVDGAKISGPAELTDKAEFQVGSSTIMLIVTEDY